MGYTREQYLYMTKLAVQSACYEEMVEFIDNLVVSSSGTELSMEERNLLSVAYKNVIGSVRAAWRIMTSIEQEEGRKNDCPDPLPHPQKWKEKKFLKLYIWLQFKNCEI